MGRGVAYKKGMLLKYFRNNFLCLYLDLKYTFGVNLVQIRSVVKAFKLATDIQAHTYIDIFSKNDFLRSRYFTPKRIFPQKLKLSIHSIIFTRK